MNAAPITGQGPLAMICGGGSLPLAVAAAVTARGREVVLFPLRGAAEGTAVERFPHHWVHIGQIGKFMRLARAAGCRDVVFIGALVRPSIWQTRPDLGGADDAAAGAEGFSRRRQSPDLEHGTVAGAGRFPPARRA